MWKMIMNLIRILRTTDALTLYVLSQTFCQITLSLTPRYAHKTTKNCGKMNLLASSLTVRLKYKHNLCDIYSRLSLFDIYESGMGFICTRLWNHWRFWPMTIYFILISFKQIYKWFTAKIIESFRIIQWRHILQSRRS